MNKSLRTREIARIHCLRRDLELSDEDYRAVLWAEARVTSTADLDQHQRRKVIQALTGHGGKPYRGRPHNADTNRRKELRKIEALLADAGRDWEYAESLARRIGKRDRLALCGPQQLYKIIAALEVDARRRLHAELTQECEARGAGFDSLAVWFARSYLGLGRAALLEKDSWCMSITLHWLRGEEVRVNAKLKAQLPQPPDKVVVPA